MNIELEFPGGKRVDARVGSFVVKTDQPAELGGEGTALAPYELFLASLATCAGIYALGFCQARGIATEGLGLTQRHELDAKSGRVTKVSLELRLPPGFPETHRAAIVRAVENCKVKKSLAEPPTFEVNTLDTAVAGTTVSATV
jgi:ribosomal protein S12 methylthiotransferase accessory factor